MMLRPIASSAAPAVQLLGPGTPVDDGAGEVGGDDRLADGIEEVGLEPQLLLSTPAIGDVLGRAVDAYDLTGGSPSTGSLRTTSHRTAPSGSTIRNSSSHVSGCDACGTIAARMRLGVGGVQALEEPLEVRRELPGPIAQEPVQLVGPIMLPGRNLD